MALAPQATVARDLSLAIGGAAMTAVAAQIQVPWEPVPFTLQSLAVMVCGLGMGRRIGAASQALYLGAGALGAPVFAGLSGGLGRMTGQTGGYLISFVLVAWVLGALAERGWTRSLPKTVAAFAIGIVLNLGLGTLWLAGYLGLSKAVAFGFTPFLPVEALKAIVAAPALPLAWRRAR